MIQELHQSLAICRALDLDRIANKAVTEWPLSSSAKPLPYDVEVIRFAYFNNLIRDLTPVLKDAELSNRLLNESFSASQADALKKFVSLSLMTAHEPGVIDGHEIVSKGDMHIKRSKRIALMAGDVLVTGAKSRPPLKRSRNSMFTIRMDYLLMRDGKLSQGNRFELALTSESIQNPITPNGRPALAVAYAMQNEFRAFALTLSTFCSEVAVEKGIGLDLRSAELVAEGLIYEKKSSVSVKEQGVTSEPLPKVKDKSWGAF